MIPRSFRKAEPWHLLLIFIFAALLWFPKFGMAGSPVCHHERSFLCAALEAFNGSLGPGGTAGQITAFLLILGLGLLLVQILNSNNLIDRATYFPSYVFILFASYHPQLISLHPVLPALFLLLIALLFIFKAYDEASALKMMFSAAFSISIASLFYFPALGFGILPWISLMIFRDFSWRNWAGAFLGLITPYIYAFSWIFIFKDIHTIREIYFSVPIMPAIPALNHPWPFFLFWALTALVLLRSIFSVLWHLNEKVISFRKKQMVVLWFMILSQITLLFSQDSALAHSIIIFVPLSFYYTIFFIQSRRKRWINDFVFLILAASLLLSFFS